jgi:rod shape-determining protein MreC
VVAALAVLALAAFFPFRRSFSFIQRPFVVAGTWVADTTFGWLQPGSVSPERVIELEAQRNVLATDAAVLRRTLDENEDLRRRLAFTERTRTRMVSARIVGRVTGADRMAFAVDIGSDDGVQEGMAVIAGDGVLVGKILSVTSTGATVSALTDQRAATAVSLLNSARTIGVAQGLDASLLTVAYIPKDQRVQVNDLLVTSGLEDAVPAGLLVGIVNAVQQEDADPFQRAVVEPLIDVRRLETVTVILGRL